jgi:hypothetical protein
MSAFRSAAVLAALLAAGPATAFDTFWHSAATKAAARDNGFSDDAANVLQFGNFSGPDFFGPLYDRVAGEKIEHWQSNSSLYARLTSFLELRDKAPHVRKMAAYMHFDNLNGALDSNLKFDYLFLKLLANTQAELAALESNPTMPEGHRKIAILEALGGSIHMVQDFYSHSDWIHQDFAKANLGLPQTSWGKPRAPTWFEARSKLGRPDTWPFKIASGIYPAVPGASNTHSHMNHDNSQLVYEEDENPGKPKNSQVPYHRAGPYPATNSDAATHQLFAVNTAAGASIEWIRLVSANPTAAAAISRVRSWIIKNDNVAMMHDMEGGLGGALLMSCAVYKWDGFNPAPARVAECKGILGIAPAVQALGMAAPSVSGIIPTPFNEFWGVQMRYDIVGALAKGFGREAGEGADYVFDLKGIQSNMPAGIRY